MSRRKLTQSQRETLECHVIAWITILGMIGAIVAAVLTTPAVTP